MRLSEFMCDSVFKNANVITMDPRVPSSELVAVKGRRIAAVAGNEILEDLKGMGVRIVDCGGKTLLPGFIDGHCHISAYAERMVSLDLSEGVRSIADIQDAVRRFCADIPAGAWVRGKGYNEFYLEEKRHLSRWDLDSAAPENPVKLTHRSGHAHVLNSLALKEAEIDSTTEDPPGGMIERDLETGMPTGLLYGMHGFLSGRIPGFPGAELERGVRRANTKLLSYGITSVQDASSSNGLKQWRRFESWKQRRLFAPRVTMMLGMEAFDGYERNAYASEIPEAELHPGSIKVMAGRVTGSLRPSRAELNRIVASIHEAGFQTAIHALEEPVIEAAVSAIEYALRRSSRPDSRHRIEHCSVCRRELLRKLAELGGAVVTQPAFLHYEGDRYLKTVPPEELERLYPFDAMLECGLTVGAGSDTPIADPNPMVSIGAAVTRSSNTGRRLPRPGIGLMQAMRMHTAGAAAVNFEESIKGTISPGKLADFVVLSENPFDVPEDRIKDIRVVMTVLDGEIVWSEPGAINC